MPFLPHENKDYQPLGQSLLSGHCLYLHSDGTIRKQPAKLYLDGPSPCLRIDVRPMDLDFSQLYWDRADFVPDWMAGDYALVLLVAVDFEFSLESLNCLGVLKIAGSDNPDAMHNEDQSKHKPGKILAFRHYVGHSADSPLLSIQDTGRSSCYSLLDFYKDPLSAEVQPVGNVA